MKLLIPSLTLLQPIFSINCYPDSEPEVVICEDLNQNLSGLEAIDWNQYGGSNIHKLKLKLNDEDPGVNEDYLPVLENTLSELGDSLTELTLIHFNNAISNRILKNAPNLDTLHISRTQVDSLPDRLFKDTNIESFRIADSEINHFNNQIFGQSNLKKLKFERNKLTSLEEDAFQHLKSIEILDLSDNDIDEVHIDVMKPLTNLKKLYLDSNGLTHLPEEFFKRNRDLRYLSLAGNDFEELPCDLLKYHFSLTGLNITNNNFEKLPCHLIHRQGEQMTEFDASNNNIHDRYNIDLSHKRGASFRLNKKGLKANGMVKTEIKEDGSVEFLEGNEKQISGTMHMVCQSCDRLPPRKILRKKKVEKEEEEGDEDLL